LSWIVVAEGIEEVPTTASAAVGRVLTSGPPAPVVILATSRPSIHQRMLSPRKEIWYLCAAESVGWAMQLQSCGPDWRTERSMSTLIVPEAQVWARSLPAELIAKTTALVSGAAAVGVPGLVKNPQAE